MSLRTRIDDAIFLWQSGRFEGALLSALVATAATSRKRYPDRRHISDHKAFVDFVRSLHSWQISVEFRGELFPVDEIFYKWLRCELVHEGEIPTDIQFLPEDSEDKLSVRAGGRPDFTLLLSRGWFHFFVNGVISAPENDADFNDLV